MYGKSVKINHWLIPVSWLYGLGVEIRNKLFDWGILPAEEFDIPVISVGNLAVGGTGKTPHIEYLILPYSAEDTNGKVEDSYWPMTSLPPVK